MTNYHELVKGKVYIGGVDAIQDAVKSMGLQRCLIYVLEEKSQKDFGEAKRHAYPIVEGVEGQDESVKSAIGAVKEAVERGEKYFSIALVDEIVLVRLLQDYY